MSIIESITGLLKPIFGLVDDVVTSDEERETLKNNLFKLQSDLMQKMMDYESKIVEQQSKIVQSEIAGASWMQRNWRPVLMFVIIAIVVNNYLFFPYAAMFTDSVKVLDLPQDLWDLMTYGTMGYVVGRSGEKIATNLLQVKK
jgi:hypothetical protein